MFKQLFSKLRGPRQVEVPGYALSGLIREGSMSLIYKAVEGETGRIVAVKFLKPAARQTIEKLESRYRDFTEGQITAALGHPNIVACFDHGTEGPESYLVLEYLEGAPLGMLAPTDSSRLDGCRMTCLLQAAEALAHVHSKGFIHHDFCGKNLFVTSDGRIKLIDFGLATPTMKAPGLMPRVGTTEVLAPEVLRREPGDHRIDIFSWGVVAYEVLSGHWPFESPEHHQTLSKIMNVHPVPLIRRTENVPEEVSNLVMRCLEKDPSKRLGSMNTAVGVFRRHSKVGI